MNAAVTPVRLDLRAEAAAAALPLEVATLTAVERDAAIGTWRGRMVNEHISARVFAGMIPQMMAAGVPASSIAEVADMIAEELRHGVQCAAVVHALGGDAVAELPPLPAVPLHADAEPLEALLRNVLSIACLSETVAVALIGAERELAGPPAMQSTLTAILADEVGHARFGWRLLETLRPRLTPELRARLGDYLVAAFRHLRDHELAHLPPNPAPSERAESYGVCDGNDARALFFETVHTVIIPGLEQHGLPAERAWIASGGSSAA
ncbi:MAG TPA: ferritin-like domain-containing protein [Kofleriaceae bacterium]|nr:ferritin-like domain-containing protein [Kofleriaceae bacterium]